MSNAILDPLGAALQSPRTLQQLAAALPKHLSADRFARIALTEVRRNPMLAQCDPGSFLSALVQAAQLGLEPGSGLGLAYLIPFRNQRKGIMECQLIPGYKGLIDLARRSGKIKRLSARPVYAGDLFDYSLGTKEHIDHKPAGNTNPKDMTHVYAVAEFEDGGVQMDVMTRNEVEAIRTRGRPNPVWNSDYAEMARKTVVRRLCKYLPLSPELADAVALEEDVEKPVLDAQKIVRESTLAAIEENDKNAEAALDKERILAIKELNRRVREVGNKGGDVEKVLGMKLDDVLQDSLQLIDAATERMGAWIDAQEEKEEEKKDDQ